MTVHDAQYTLLQHFLYNTGILADHDSYLTGTSTLSWPPC